LPTSYPILRLFVLLLTSLYSCYPCLPSSASSTFLFFLCHSPMTSTLFPYTALFRSVQEMGIRSLDVEVSNVSSVPSPPSAIGFIDRKSTRLNSSHVSNSYAVFCLKKKIDRPAVIRQPMLRNGNRRTRD